MRMELIMVLAQIAVGISGLGIAAILGSAAIDSKYDGREFYITAFLFICAVIMGCAAGLFLSDITIRSQDTPPDCRVIVLDGIEYAPLDCMQSLFDDNTPATAPDEQE